MMSDTTPNNNSTNQVGTPTSNVVIDNGQQSLINKLNLSPAKSKSTEAAEKDLAVLRDELSLRQDDNKMMQKIFSPAPGIFLLWKH